MICPNCGHRFTSGCSPEVKQKALELYARGYSLRMIEKELKGEISFSTASRVIKEFIAEKLNLPSEEA